MAIQRYERTHFDAMYYVTGSEQSFHFSQLFKILELLDFDWVTKCHHVPFGRIKGMSTREGSFLHLTSSLRISDPGKTKTNKKTKKQPIGKVYFLDDILEESTAHMRTIMLEGTEKQLPQEKVDVIAPKVSLSAVVVQDLQAKRVKEYEFDLKRMTDTRGDTGPYIQYTHARLAR